MSPQNDSAQSGTTTPSYVPNNKRLTPTPFSELGYSTKLKTHKKKLLWSESQGLLHPQCSLQHSTRTTSGLLQPSLQSLVTPPSTRHENFCVLLQLLPLSGTKPTHRHKKNQTKKQEEKPKEKIEVRTKVANAAASSRHSKTNPNMKGTMMMPSSNAKI